MARVTADYKRLFLRGAKWDAATAEQSLYAQLKTLAQAKLTQNSSGLVLTGTSTNGHSVTLSLPANGQGANPQTIAELCSEMLDRWEAAVEYLELTRSESSTTDDDAIFAEMMSRLKAVRSYGMDCSQIRTGPVEVAS